MASLPPQSGAQPQRRRSSPASRSTEPDEQSETNPQPLQEAPTQSTDFLPNPSSSSSNQTKPGDVSGELQTTQTHQGPSTDDEPRKCWICFTDETEDTPLSSQWRSPCPCALTAHESCILDWVADLENPSNRKRSAGSKILCPQCKSEIHIARPRSFALDGMRAVERIAGRMVLPGVVLTLAGTFWAGCAAHGYSSIYLIFGFDDTLKILHLGDDNHGLFSAKKDIGLPLIPVALILSRTRYADLLLPMVPLFFYVTHPVEEDLSAVIWPPTAVMTFATLPYIRALYNKFYEKVFAPLEQKWLKEVQPRAGEENGGDQDRGQQNVNFANAIGDVFDEAGEVDENVAMIEVAIEVGEDDEEDEVHADDGAARPPENGQGDQNQAGQNQNGQQNQMLGGAGQDNLIINTSRIADTVLGALLFPSISAAVGGLLHLGLPKTWTTAPSSKGKLGLLQTRWGRSVVGGCLFVVLKDALVLYCRWKLAQSHRKRRVLNYDRKAKKVTEA